MPDEKRPITAEDLYNLQLVTDPQISPDGQLVVFGLIRVDKNTEKRHTNLWLAAADGSTPPRQITFGDHTDTYARWSPDGRTIAFLSNRKDEKQMQLYLLPVDGGEARPLTNMQGSFSGFAWSPDGKRFVTQFRKKDADAIEREKDEQKKKLGVVVRHITRLDYKFDGAGYLPKEKWHIWTIDAETGEAVQLTDGDKDEEGPVWSADGRFIYFVSNRDERDDVNWDESEIYRIPANGGDMELIPSRPGRKFGLSASPDGRWLAFKGRERKGHWYQNTNLYIVPAAGGEVRPLSVGTDLHLALASLTDTGSGSPEPAPTWSADSSQIFVLATEKGNQPLLAFPIDGKGYRRIIDEPGLIGTFTLDAANDRIAYLWGEMLLPGQVRVRHLPSAQTHRLTHFNQELLDEIAWGDIEEVTIQGPDNNEIQGWILKPANFDPSQKYPSILEIHGGPQTQYARALMHEFHFLNANGYVVYWCNPRGSQGYGEAFAGAIYNQWGTVDYADVMAWADYVEKLPYIDPNRMGVTGGSYGGYMTTLIIGKTHRFKAAVGQRVVSNLISFYGASDLHHGTEELMGPDVGPWDDLESYWRMSPIAYIGNAKTPTMIIHSERDFRCPQEQGEQVFTALRRLGVDTEFILFPDESHGLSRIGRTDRRIQRLQHMLRWFDTYLK